MGMSVGGKRGIVSDMNVVPLIDILLVLLVIFMIIPKYSVGLDALVPQPARPEIVVPQDEVVVVQVLADGTLSRRAAGAVGVVLDGGQVLALEGVDAFGDVSVTGPARFMDSDGAAQDAPDIRTRGTCRIFPHRAGRC